MRYCSNLRIRDVKNALSLVWSVTSPLKQRMNLIVPARSGIEKGGIDDLISSKLFVNRASLAGSLEKHCKLLPFR